jgi:hypothetical protein
MASGTDRLRPHAAIVQGLKAQTREQHNICRFQRFRQRLLLRLNSGGIEHTLPEIGMVAAGIACPDLVRGGLRQGCDSAGTARGHVEHSD